MRARIPADPLGSTSSPDSFLSKKRYYRFWDINNCHTKKDSPHRYLDARCFLYSPILAFLRDPRIERRIGASRVTGEDGPVTAAR